MSPQSYFREFTLQLCLHRTPGTRMLRHAVQQQKTANSPSPGIEYTLIYSINGIQRNCEKKTTNVSVVFYDQITRLYSYLKKGNVHNRTYSILTFGKKEEKNETTMSLFLCTEYKPRGETKDLQQTVSHSRWVRG